MSWRRPMLQRERERRDISLHVDVPSCLVNALWYMILAIRCIWTKKRGVEELIIDIQNQLFHTYLPFILPTLCVMLFDPTVRDYSHGRHWLSTASDSWYLRMKLEFMKNSLTWYIGCFLYLQCIQCSEKTPTHSFLHIPQINKNQHTSQCYSVSLVNWTRNLCSSLKQCSLSL